MLFRELSEVEKEVILVEGTPPAESSSWNDVDVAMKGETDTSEGGVWSGQDGSAIDPTLLSPRPLVEAVDVVGLSKQSTPQPNVVKIIKKIEYELLCPQHNPVRSSSLFSPPIPDNLSSYFYPQIIAAAKRASKQDRVRTGLLAMPAMSRIKVRVSAGVFEVSLLSVNEERGMVEVLWDDGMRREFKWGALVWGKTEGLPVGQKPSVSAAPNERESPSRIFSIFG